MTHRPFLLLVVAAALAGCSTAPRPAVAPPRGAAIDTAAVLEPLVRSLTERMNAVHTLRGRADVEVSSVGWEGSSEFEAAVVVARPDQLHLRGYAGPVTAFDLVSAGGHFWAYVRDRRELWTGPVPALERKVGIPALGQALVSALAGDPFGPPEDARLVSMTADRAVVEWAARDGGVAKATIRRLDQAPLSIVWQRDGKTMATVRYDDFVHETEGLWPRKLSFHWSEPPASLRLAFHDQQLNHDLPAEAFTPPDPQGAKHVEFSDPDSSERSAR